METTTLRRPGARKRLQDPVKVGTQIERRYFEALVAYAEREQIPLTEAFRRAIENLLGPQPAG